MFYNLGGNCSECHPDLNCKKFPNGESCECQQDSCGTNQQCNVSITNRLANPCSCLPNYIEENPKSCIGKVVLVFKEVFDSNFTFLP